MANVLLLCRVASAVPTPSLPLLAMVLSLRKPWVVIPLKPCESRTLI
jgi:hypothetical protein